MKKVRVFELAREFGMKGPELAKLLREIGFENIKTRLATRPEDAMGDPALWAKAEQALASALDKNGWEGQWVEAPGEGAFYGPKIEVHVTDALGRSWQCGTVQVDFSMPARFGLEYTGRDGQKHTPVMIHRAILGSMERFVGILIEHYAGKFPLWLAPVQAKVLSITEKQADYAEQVAAQLVKAGIRAEADVRGDKVGSKVRDATLERVNYMLVVGGREAEEGKVDVRSRAGDRLGAMGVEDFIAHAREETAARR